MVASHWQAVTVGPEALFQRIGKRSAAGRPHGQKKDETHIQKRFPSLTFERARRRTGTSNIRNYEIRILVRESDEFNTGMCTASDKKERLLARFSRMLAG